MSFHSKATICSCVLALDLPEKYGLGSILRRESKKLEKSTKKCKISRSLKIYIDIQTTFQFRDFPDLDFNMGLLNNSDLKKQMKNLGIMYKYVVMRNGSTEKKA
ncbi:hypothetical protein BpHYR1_029013 [Brachionus plicatilis]|uniref:Uncharacterized protein n=1 Tax=Brachionus plicatilis TaxID=10195 RepID=A0A3M7SWE5_BRAPC|nr:hypothetical protein BpHYR1_029013 [Brachionus plicatilis]